MQGHKAIADFESRHEATKTITVITQNVDGLHARAGTKNLIELHGNLYKTRCTKCKEVLVNNDSPICEVLYTYSLDFQLRILILINNIKHNVFIG